MTHVVDTSVAVKWLVAEEGSDAAERLIGEDLIAPDLLLVELGNVAWKKWRRKEIGADLARLIPSAGASFVTLIASAPLTEKALDLAIDLGHPIYDCYFLALAELSGRKLITADKRLFDRCVATRFEPMVERLEFRQ